MKKSLWIGLAFLVVLVGCDIASRDFYRAEDDLFDPTKGQLVLVLDGSSIGTKTITPNMEIATYDLHFHNSSTGEDFTPTISASESFIYSEPGFTPSDVALDWSVDVTARNDDGTPGTPIGAIDGIVGTPFAFTVNAGETTTIVVNVIPLIGDNDGFGRLRIYISWPDAAGSDEVLTATLTPDPTLVGTFQDGFDILPPFVPPGTNIRTAVYDSNVSGELLPIGYYTLNLQLQDGSDLLWGWMEAVRIVESLDTDTLDTKFALQLSDAGSVYFDGIGNTNMNNPVIIAFTPAATYPPTTLVADQRVTATLTLPAPPSISYDYEWYLDGAPTGVSENNFNTSIAPFYDIVVNDFLGDSGQHNLSLMITGRIAVGGAIETLSSENFPFIIP